MKREDWKDGEGIAGAEDEEGEGKGGEGDEEEWRGSSRILVEGEET